MQRAGRTTHWRVLTNAQELAEQATALILETARAAIAAHDVFYLVLAGGTTPKHVYQNLRSAGANWSQWHLYFGDERCLPRGHRERNDTLVFDAWLNHVKIPQANIHTIPAELGAQLGAERYANLLRDVPEFDLVLLGLGEDGHTASLFPGRTDGLKDSDPAAIAVFDAPKPPPERVSLSAARLSRSHRVLYLVSGSTKRAAIEAWRSAASIPPVHIRPIQGVDVFVDQAAWPEQRS